MNTIIFCIVIVAIFALGSFLFPRKIDTSAMERHAKRLARLLIAEIRLSEPYKVDRGLKNNNILTSCETEIDEARKKFKRRFSEKNFEAFIDDAILELLANGDPAKL